MKRVFLVMTALLFGAPALCFGQGRIVLEGGEALVKQMTKRGGAPAACRWAAAGAGSRQAAASAAVHSDVLGVMSGCPCGARVRR